MEKSVEAVAAAVKTLRDDIKELESNFAYWDSESTAGGKRLRSIAQRIVLSGRRVETLVKENTYSP
jgi:hypothetical protein